MQVWESVAAERRALADLLDTLSPEQLATPSLCDAWTVREVAAHLVVSHTVTMPGFAVALARARGSFARANVSLTTSQAARPTNELVADLRKHAQSRSSVRR
ncbi:MAG: maleylpyruvate isomerase family mycothiol-dependent enzyme, partial [Nocardioidaceae bacterium]